MLNKSLLEVFINQGHCEDINCRLSNCPFYIMINSRYYCGIERRLRNKQGSTTPWTKGTLAAEILVEESVKLLNKYRVQKLGRILGNGV